MSEHQALQRAIEKDVQFSLIRYPKRWRVRQRDAALIIFLLHTGLRIQEMLDLQLADLEIGERKGKIIVRQGKGGKQRVIPLNSDACKAIQGWLAIRPKTESLFVWIAVEKGENGALSSRSVQRVVLRFGNDAGLERLTPHVLRHTFGKNLIDSGVGIEKVAALLGNANLNTTRVYITPNQNDLEKAVDQLSMNN
jgi:site-specific recombinase XerD